MSPQIASTAPLKFVFGVDIMTASYMHIEDYVLTFYLKMGIRKPHDLDFQKVAEELGIKVFYWSEASQALFTGDNGFILLEEYSTEQQQWQDFCHELAHVLLHVGNQSKMNESFRQYQEAKANNFMYHAAVPTFMLDELNIMDLLPGTIYRVQKLFNVEAIFAEKRLKQYLNKKYAELEYIFT